MATKETPAAASKRGRPVEAPVLGTTRVPPAVGEVLVHPDPAPLHAVPSDAAAEASLARVETLLGQGQFGTALREIAAVKVDDPPLAARYGFIRQEKLSRAQLGVADRYVVRGELKKARAFYEQALGATTADAAVRDVAKLAVKAFDDLVAQRAKLIAKLEQNVQKGNFEAWCGQKKALTGLTLLDQAGIRARMYPDFRLESSFGERPPLAPAPGYLDPLPVETPVVAFSSPVPGTIFRAATDGGVDVDQPQAGIPGDPPGSRVRASLALPVVANVLKAKLGLFALDQGLSLTGQADGTVPLFRYEFLRDKAKEMIAHVQGIESRMLPIQFALDDFAEIVDAIRRPLAAQEAELAAVNQKIGELTQSIAQLVQIKQALDPVIVALDKVQDDCDCDWFCWLVAIVADAFVVAIAVAAILAVGAATAATAGIGGALLFAITVELGIALGIGAGIWTGATVTCDNVGTISRSMKASRDGVEASIADSEAELQHALARRDVLIASINALSQELDAIYQSNAARVLDAKTLDAIQAQYNSLRQSLLTRAQAVAKLAENAFNFERDSATYLIKDAYYDTTRKGYGAAETLLYDLDGLDHIDVTGRTQKSMQLSQMVSLRRHSPLSFLALAMTRTARFTTALEDFDRWYPGTYLQRIKEIRVEVIVDDQPVPARGYLSNDGVSLVRFVDTGNARPVDNVRVFAEPDPELATLCYKRLQRRRHVDTMAFPAFESALYGQRMDKLQDRERNFFENVGLESTWVIELLPDQPFDLARISDVRVWFQYEALFDENLKRVLDAKRYAGRREMAAFSLGRLVRDAGRPVDFGDLTFKTSPALFEAPAVEKTIVDAGLAVRLKDGKALGGAASLEVSLESATPVAVKTNEQGVVATAPDHPAGTGLAQLAAMVQGKKVVGDWTVRLTGMPAGFGADDVNEIFLLLHYEYAA
jgi:hypothetical protein